MYIHDEYVKKIIANISADGTLKSRESNTVEFKEAFNKNSIAKYGKIMASYSNNRGGYIIFGVKDKPRKVVGLRNDNFENMNQEQFSDALNSLFAPAMDWRCGTFTIDLPSLDPSNPPRTLKIGWIYTEEAEYKPIIAQKMNDGEKISNGDVFYRYRARSEKIRYAEMSQIIEKRLAREREGLFKLFEVIQKNGTANLGIVNYSNGKITTPYGVDVAFDKKIVTQVLKKAKFIKEGSFNETDGIPVIKVTGNIDLAEEVPVPEGNPDETHPYIQKQLAEELAISRQDLYALIWYFKMKKSKKYHLEITTSSSSANKTHKFSNFALQVLKDKIKEFDDKPEELDHIRQAYKDRNKTGGNA